MSILRQLFLEMIFLINEHLSLLSMISSIEVNVFSKIRPAIYIDKESIL
jgi:hypothetical protein